MQRDSGLQVFTLKLLSVYREGADLDVGEASLGIHSYDPGLTAWGSALELAGAQ